MIFLRKYFIFFLLLFMSSSAFGGQRYNARSRQIDYCTTIQEEDGSPSNKSCRTLKVPNGKLTDNGSDYSLSVSPVAGDYAAASIDGDDVNSNIAGRSLTLTSASPDTLDADTELYTETKCIWFESPTNADDFESIWTANGFAATITKMWCESDGTVNMDLAVDDGSVADVNGADLACASTPVEDESMGGDATLADGDRLDLLITSTSGTPTWVSICWTFTYDD